MNEQTLDLYLRQLTEFEETLRTGKIEQNLFDTLDHVFYMDNFEVLDLGKPGYEAKSLGICRHSRFASVPLHTHAWVEVSYIYSGSVCQTINGQDIILEKGQVIIVDQDIPHAIGETGENDIMINLLLRESFFTPAFVSKFQEKSIVSDFIINAMTQQNSRDNYMVFQSQNDTRLQMYFRELMCEYYDPSLNSENIIESFLILIFSELINLYEDDLNISSRTPASKSVVPILRYIEANCQSCTLESTAQFFFLHPNYLTRLLKQATGFSFKQLIQAQRFRQAEFLLRSTSLSVEEIAHRSGYHNVSFFYRKFKELYGYIPSEYRLQFTPES